MVNIDDKKITLFNKLNKLREKVLNTLIKKYYNKYSIVDIEELVDKSIVNSVLTYEKEKGAKVETLFYHTLKNLEINLNRDYELKTKEGNDKEGNKKVNTYTRMDVPLDVNEEDEQNKKSKLDGYAEKTIKTGNSNIDALTKYFDYGKNLDMELIRINLSKFFKTLNPEEKIMFNELRKIVYRREDYNIQQIAKVNNIDHKKVYKIRDNIRNKFIMHVKKLSTDEKKLYREIIFNPKPSEKSLPFAYSINSDEIFNTSEERSALDKTIILISKYQYSRLFNFINNINDQEIEMLYNKV